MKSINCISSGLVLFWVYGFPRPPKFTGLTTRKLNGGDGSMRIENTQKGLSGREKLLNPDLG